MFHINYLQAEKNYTILHSMSEILGKNHLEGADSLTSLADKSISKRGWSVVLLEAYDGQTRPTFTSELIPRINAAHQQEMM